MRYEGSVYRPPSEADSLIVQATIGCSHNRCLFCTMYKAKQFRIRPLEEILAELEWAAEQFGRSVLRVFLADGDALTMKTGDLLAVLNRCRQLFPGLRRVGLYGSPQSILRKSPEELVQLREAGLGILYLGIESGSDTVLSLMEKGVDAEAMISAGQRVRHAGITLSAMLILGLGGTALSDEHARESARVCNAIEPDYLSLLTLMVDEEAPLKRLMAEGAFVEPGPRAALEELRTLVDGLELEWTVLRSNHASNYVSINGRLPKDKARVLQEIDRCLENGDRCFSTYRRL